MKIIVIIVAAGRGTRLGGKIPKQYMKIAGKSLLRHSIDTFHNHIDVDEICVVYNKADHFLYEKSIKGLQILHSVEGGLTRQESVFNGLNAIKSINPDIALIHDAARAFVDQGTITRVINKIKATGDGVIPALPVNDTLKSIDYNIVEGTSPREKLYRAQTPQGFIFSKIYQAHENLYGKSLTDDASIFEEVGEMVRIVEGSEYNFKVTSKEDFMKAEKLFGFEEMETRVGQGFDVHKFKDGNSVTLCGIKVPHSQSLKGHSDADVALHAITDALLGAISKGDIGDHFPPTDTKWKDVPSSLFLQHARDLIEAEKGKITNIDLTILCEAPKITPYKEKMRNNVAEILNISPYRVSVKATTTERLGFTGREEGIAAMATASIKLKIEA
jgi:2-C-methyl-D-erythritol 4-phosphate cytidylyltransferase / 2-C-methyl-D-erythritol 2,4-cyclodiphosphate synthase